MNTTRSITTNNSVHSRPIELQVSPDTRQLLTLGHQRGWGAEVLGRAPLPSAPVRLGQWLLVPAHLDTSSVPTRTLERVQAIYANGLRPQGFVIVHEAPGLLPAPKTIKTNPRPPDPKPNLMPALKIAGGVVGVLGVTAAAATGLAVLAMGAVLLTSTIAVPTVLLASAALLDPMMIAVTEDYYWIEIDRWWS